MTMPEESAKQAWNPALSKWYFLNEKSETCGPHSLTDLTTKFVKGDIDGCTLLWASGMKTWNPISATPWLKCLFQNIEEPDDDEDAAFHKAVESHIGSQSKNSKRKKETTAVSEASKPSKKKKKWTSKSNTWIYITGLDTDITIESLKDIFSKFGVLQVETLSGNPRIKIYRDEDGRPKGDASICYLREPSVQLAIQLMDGVAYKPGYKLSIKSASFDKKIIKDESETKNSKKRLKSKNELSAIEKKQYQAAISARRREARNALSWSNDVENSTNIVVLKKVFVPGRCSISKYPDATSYIEELRVDIKNGCSKVGEVKKVTLATESPEGVVLVKFKTSTAAKKCVELMNGRFFDGRNLIASLWDGFTNYMLNNVMEETFQQVSGALEKEEKQRIDAFGDWLDKGGSSSDDEN